MPYRITLFLLLTSSLLFGQRTEELRKRTNRIIHYDTRINLEEIPGIITGMIDKDSTYILDFGYADKDSGEKLNEHTIFEIGSLTKVFTMSLLAVLVEENLLSYHSRVNDLLPDSCINKYADHLLIKDLVMHTSGLPKLPKDFGFKQKDVKDPYAFYTKDDLRAFYGTFPFENSSNPKYLYSHVNYALLEIIIEHICQKGYGEVLEEKIISPLNMNDTFLGINEKLYKNASKAYSLSGKENEFWTFQSFEGSMGLKSSLHDLLILIRTYVGLMNSEYTEIFSSCFQERIPTDIIDKLDASYAWYIYNNKKYYDVILCAGRGNGHQVTIHFVPETQTGVIVLANAPNSLDNLGYMMLALVNNHWKLKRKKRRALKK